MGPFPLGGRHSQVADRSFHSALNCFFRVGRASAVPFTGPWRPARAHGVSCKRGNKGTSASNPETLLTR